MLNVKPKNKDSHSWFACMNSADTFVPRTGAERFRETKLAAEDSITSDIGLPAASSAILTKWGILPP